MSNKNKTNIIPVIDLFAGPGGLNEGFSHKIGEERRFKSVLSVEKEAPEHQTLSLRAFYRYFLYRDLPVPQEYYDYIQKRNKVTREQLWKKYPDAAAEADNEALQYTLGEDDGPQGFPFLADTQIPSSSPTITPGFPLITTSVISSFSRLGFTRTVLTIDGVHIPPII